MLLCLCIAMCMTGCGAKEAPESDAARMHQDTQDVQDVQEQLETRPKLLEHYLTLKVGQRHVLACEIFGVQTDLTWSSDDSSVVAVTKGELMRTAELVAGREGTATVTVSDGENSDFCQVKVIAAEQEAPAEESPQPAIFSVTLKCGAEIPLDAEIADLTGFQVDDLSGLEQCGQLREIFIDGGQLKSVSRLAKLENLEQIQLNNVPVADISPLLKLPKLRTLDVTGTAVDARTLEQLQAQYAEKLRITPYVSHSYYVYTDPNTWYDANGNAKELGGHLATIQSEEEFQKICALAEKSGLSYFWLGGSRWDEQWNWTTDEEWVWADWYPWESNGRDYDNTDTTGLCLWKAPEGWRMYEMDQGLFALSSVERSLGYIVEVEEFSDDLQDGECKVVDTAATIKPYIGIWASGDAPNNDPTGEYHTYYLGIFDNYATIRWGYRCMEVGNWSLNENGEIEAVYSECFYDFPGDGDTRLDVEKTDQYAYDPESGLLCMTDSSQTDDLHWVKSYRVNWMRAYTSCASHITRYGDAGINKYWFAQMPLNIGLRQLSMLWRGLEGVLYSELSDTLTGTALVQLKNDEAAWLAYRDSQLIEVGGLDGGTIRGTNIGLSDCSIVQKRVEYFMDQLALQAENDP